MLDTTRFLYLKRQHEYDRTLTQQSTSEQIKKPLPALGTRDGETGLYTVKFPNGGEALAGRLIFTGGVPEGTMLKATQPAGSGAIALHGQDATPIEPLPKTFAYPTTKTIPVKVLFSIKKDGKLRFFIGGDRSTPEEIFSLPDTQAALACLQNIGSGKDDWLFSVRYWPENAGGIDLSGICSIKTISPVISTQNWELNDLPSGLIYAGAGVWYGKAGPGICISLDIYTGLASIRSDDPYYQEKAWQQRTGYKFPIGLISSPSQYSLNFGSSIVWSGKVQYFMGRFIVPVVLQQPYYFPGDYSFSLEYGIAVISNKLITKIGNNKNFAPALINPDFSQALYRESDKTELYFVKSRLLTANQDTDLTSPGGDNAPTNWFGITTIDPIQDWTPRETTIVDQKAYRVDISNFFTGYPSKTDLEWIKKVDPQTKRGGIIVYSLEPSGNKIVVSELPDRIEVPDLIKLGYEDDPTLFIHSISYYPKQ